MNKTLLVFIILFIAIGTLAFFGVKVYEPLPKEEAPVEQVTETETQETVTLEENMTTTPETVPTNAKTVDVTYTDIGFSPKNIEVSVGDSVRFVNNSSSVMWVASDSHPTHTDHPEFDNKTAVAKGGEYVFMFDEAGTWGYHNHLKSSDLGVVTVTE